MPFALRQLISRGYFAPAGDDGADPGSGSGDTPQDTEPDRGDKLDPPEGKEGEKDVFDEEVETEEEKAERLAAEAAEDRKKRIRIPKARFDEVVSKARQREQELQEKIARLEASQQSAVTQEAVGNLRAKIKELNDKYEDLILDGKKDEARKVRTQLENLRDDLAEYQTSVKAEIARRTAIDEVTYNSQLANFEAKYPVLNPEHADFDEARTDEVAALLNALVKSGHSRADALSKAVRYVLGSPPAGGTSSLHDTRAVDARKRAAEADKRQPPSTKGVGQDSDKAGSSENGGINVLRMTQGQFEKLDETALAKLRGDEL